MNENHHLVATDLSPYDTPKNPRTLIHARRLTVVAWIAQRTAAWSVEGSTLAA